MNKGKYFFDDGTEYNPDLFNKPSLCLICKKNEDLNEEMICNLTRMDQYGNDDFICHGFKKNEKK